MTPMTLTEIFDVLPLTERTLLKRRASYHFTITNDTGHPSIWRVLVGDREVGMVRYYRGRKLAAYRTVERPAREEG